MEPSNIEQSVVSSNDKDEATKEEAGPEPMEITSELPNSESTESPETNSTMNSPTLTNPKRKLSNDEKDTSVNIPENSSNTGVKVYEPSVESVAKKPRPSSPENPVSTTESNEESTPMDTVITSDVTSSSDLDQQQHQIKPTLDTPKSPDSNTITNNSKLISSPSLNVNTENPNNQNKVSTPNDDGSKSSNLSVDTPSGTPTTPAEDTTKIRWDHLRANLSIVYDTNKISSSTNNKSAKEEALGVALSTVLDLRRKIEIVHSTEYPTMLSTLLPSFVAILRKVPPCPVPSIPPSGSLSAANIAAAKSGNNTNESDQQDDKSNTILIEFHLRNSILELCSRFPHNEILRPYASSLCSIALEVLEYDYEDNALLATRIIFDLHKNYRPILSDLVQPFIDFVISAYRNVPTSVNRNFTFQVPVAPPQPTQPSTPSSASSNLPPSYYQALNPFNSPRSSFSFKVLTECPLALMLLFQIYPKYTKNNILKLIPIMMDMLALRPLSVDAYLTPVTTAASSSNKDSSSMKNVESSSTPTTTPSADQQQQNQNNNNLIQRLHYKRSKELLSCQVKTLSFLTYLLRSYNEQIKSYEDRLASHVLGLFAICPRETTGALRKELLIALRHILTTNFRTGFYRHIDSLLDERVLIGKYRQSEHAQIRAIAYGALADLIPHIRTQLSLAQISRIVHLYSRVLHDASMSLPISLQSTGIRLMLNLVDPTFHNQEERASSGRDIIFRIFECSIHKLKVLADRGMETVERYEAEKILEKERETKSIGSLNVSLCPGPEEKTARVSIFLMNEGQSSSENDDSKHNRLYDSCISSSDSIQNVRDLITPIVTGLKTLMWCLQNYGAQRDKLASQKAEQSGKEESKSVSDDVSKSSNKSSAERKQPKSWYEDMALQRINVMEKVLIEEYIKACFKVLQLFKPHTQEEKAKEKARLESLPASASSSERIAPLHREVLEHFASSLIVLDSFTFQRTVGSHMSELLDAIVEDEAFMIIPKTLLAQDSHISYDFSTSLLSHLLTELKLLSTLQANDSIDQGSEMKHLIKKESVMLKLLVVGYSSMTAFPKNEGAFLPFLQPLVACCLRMTMNSAPTSWPGKYLKLLRSMFRSIAGGKFEDSYKELLPLLPPLLNGLYRIYCSTDHILLRHTIIELCLSVPARLSSLLPHLSLLLRVIIPALQSNDGDLVNLGLRTLEFWIDNLNIEFLWPILSQDSDLLSQLMKALTYHLRPAPYQYGLLTLRLLGKLGGKNRLFLQEPMMLDHDNVYRLNNETLSIKCSLHPSPTVNGGGEKSFSLPLPITKATDILEWLSNIVQPSSSIKDENYLSYVVSCNSKVEDLDIASYNIHLLSTIYQEQANAAFTVLKSALAAICQITNDHPSCGPLSYIDYSEETNLATNAEKDSSTKNSLIEEISNKKNHTFKVIVKGLFFASLIQVTSEQADLMLSGLLSHIILIVNNRFNCVYRFSDDFDLIKCSDKLNDSEPIKKPEREPNMNHGKLQPLSPFGQFKFSDPLLHDINYFVINEVITEMFTLKNAKARQAAIKVLDNFYLMLKRLGGSNQQSIGSDGDTNNKCLEYFFESLLYNLCQACLSSFWNTRKGIYEGICKVIDLMGHEWTRIFEVELVHVALFSLQDFPDEIPKAEREALIFYMRLFRVLYGNDSMGLKGNQSPILLRDCLELHQNDTDDRSSNPVVLENMETESEICACFPASDAVLEMLVSELGSKKSIVRFVARISLEQFHTVAKAKGSSTFLNDLLGKHISLIKRLIFSRSLRSLPLQDQVATIEYFSFVTVKASELLPLMDNLVLAFLTELLRIMSVADGEMTSESISNSIIVDKDGYCPSIETNNYMIKRSSVLSHASGIFLRERYVVKDKSISVLLEVPTQLVCGVQMRYSSIVLFRNVINAHNDVFFEPGNSSSIGNILPHVVSLLFRSLISAPEQAVVAAHAALHDLLAVSRKEEGGSTKSFSHRLPKNLLQTCIRPVLLNLKDYTKLSIPLLKGLARLLSLLSSWFSKSLGDKLLEHLQRWCDPDKIISQKIWKEGEEPLVAAAIIDLFELLPEDSSHFVEPLVKTTLKLEAVLPRYKGCFTDSPFRKPLAKYLNKYGSAVSAFFINDHRLSNPMYSDLLQDIIRRKESEKLRAYLSGPDCSTTLLNTCFERPLAIIRSEKSSTSSSTPRNSSDILSVHGIQYDSSGKKQASSNDATVDGSVNSMSPEALELQRQGLLMVETLINNDPKYVVDHHNIVRAFRWLWRSKGRHFRLLHEDSMPPRYNIESKMLAHFLLNYSESDPNDVDVLFDLLRIFLQPTTSDFSFVQSFLKDMVNNELRVDQKKRILNRFFAVLASEGIEELKVLSIQLLVLPMLIKHFESSNASLPSVNNQESLFDKELTREFVTDVILKNSKLDTNRLSVEILKILSLLLENMWNEVSEYQQDLIKFVWSLLKSEDMTTKLWAYINVCRYIAVYHTPSKIIFQVYVALLRSFQQEAKDLVRVAIDVLIPVLSKKLSSDDYTKVMKVTVKVLYEEGNSLPQLSHMLHIIVRHESIFFDYRNKFVPHLVTGLNKLGLPLTSSYENRELSLAVLKMLLFWEEKQYTFKYHHDVKCNLNTMDVDTPRSSIDTHLFASLGSPESSPSKKKHIDDNSISSPTKGVHMDTSSLFTLSDSEVEVIANYLVRLILLLADAEGEQETLKMKSNHLFRVILSRWTKVEIRGAYFEKVVSLCVHETNSMKERCNGNMTPSTDKQVKEKGSKSKNGSKGNETSTKKGVNSKANIDTLNTVSTCLLVSCLDIFIIIIDCAPKHNFLLSNSGKVYDILGPCFRRAALSEEIGLRDKLKKFLVMFLSQKGTSSDHFLSILEYTKGRLENFLHNYHSDTKYVHNIHFVLDTLEGISDAKPSLLNSFMNDLLFLSEKLFQVHLESLTSKGKKAVVSSNSSDTPSMALLEELNQCASKYDETEETEKTAVKRLLDINSDMNSGIHCLIISLRLLEKCSLLYSSLHHRQSFVSLLGKILEKSTDMMLLLSCCLNIRQLVREPTPYGTIPLKERKNLLSKLMALDTRGLSEIKSHLLSNIITFILIEVQRHDSSLDLNSKMHLSDYDALLRRSLTASMLSSNSRLRSLAVGIFISGENGFQFFEHGKRSLCPSIDYDSYDSMDFTGTDNPDPPFDILMNLLNNDFESLVSRLWTAIFVDVLLATSYHTEGITLHIEASPEKFARKEWISAPITHRSNSTNQGLQDFLNDQYMTFRNILLREKSSCKNRHGCCISAVRLLLTFDTTTSQEYLEFLMCKYWELLSSDNERLELTHALEKLLSRSTYSQFVNITVQVTSQSNYLSSKTRETNVIKCLLSVVAKLRPLPMLSLELLLSLAANYNCWHEVRSIFEMQYHALEKVTNEAVLSCKAMLLSAIRRCFMELGEKDIWTTMKAKMCVFPSSHRAVSLDLYGRIEDALDCYSKLVEDVDSRRDDFQAKSSSLPSELEASLWEDQWVTLHRELCQWSVLSDYAKETGSLRLLMECAWKNKEWENLRSILSYPSIISLLETGDFEVKMSEIFLSIADGKLNEVENLHAQTAQICLYKWRLLPTIFSGCNAHSKLLHNFHRLVDIKESGQIMMETSAHVVAKTYPDLKNLLSVWRCRLPNEFDPISCWDDIFQWRSHMFAAITTTFNWAEQGTLASLHDRPWTAIRMAKTARKLKVKDVALLALGQLTDCAMDVSDAFSKLREQILSFKDGTDIERTGGLNLIHTTNLSYFDPQQKSELFRLKAEFLESLGSKAKMTDTFSKATKAYCHAIQLCPTYSRSWTCWGKLCWSLADLFERQSSLLDPNTVEEKEKAMATTKKVCGYLAQAMGCWMEAIQCDSGANMRAYLPRCLLMLSKDGSNPGLLCATFEKYSLSLPSWVWMTWIPQLLTSLYRLEAKTAKSILNSVLMEYPQSLYFQLRSYYLERRDLQRSQSNSSGNQSVAFAEELMSALRKNHPTLWISLESILEELIIRFRQCYEEDLLATVTALLQRADAQLEQQRRCQDSKEFDEVALRASFSTTLARVSAKFFRPQTDASSTAKEERVKRAIEFSRRYKVLFEEDFAMSTDGKEERSNSVLTLSNIHEKLKKWVKILEREVSQKPPFLPLMQISPSLSSFCSSSPDLWPGACDTSFSNTSHSKAMKAQTDPLVNQSPSSSAASAAAAATAAAVSVAAACRFEGGPGAYGGSSAAVEIPGQYAPNNSNDSKPIPELNAKLSKFHPIVKFSQQGDHLVRHIGMIGSDGQYHQFLLQFAIPYWTRADERTTQLNQIFGRMIRNETLTSKRHLWFKPTPVIPIAQRLRMTAAKDCQISLENVYIAHCNNIDADHSFPIRYFTDKIRTNHSADVKVNAYRSICEEHVSSRILVEHMENDLGDVERFFHFQRNFTAQVALYSLLQYIFNANERSPNKFVFSASNAQVLHTDLRFSYSNQGFLDEKKAVPFRLTRNIQELIGPFLVDGVFIPSFASASAALNTCRDELTSTLQLLLRDDIVAWYVSKSAQREGSRSTLELEQQLTDRVAKNVAFIQERIEECTPNNEDEESPLDVGTKRLVAIATSETNLASMPATFCSWL